MQALSFLSQVSNKPVLFFRAVRSCISTAGHWTIIPNELSKQARYSHIFSAVHGFLGARKLVLMSHAKEKASLPEYVWVLSKRIKKVVAAVGWFCKAGKDKGYFVASVAAWTSYLKVVQVPFDCISLGFSILKISRIAFEWIRLQHLANNDQLNAQMFRLQTKAEKELFYSASKVLDITAFVLEHMVPTSLAFISANAIVATSVKIAALTYATIRFK